MVATTIYMQDLQRVCMTSIFIGRKRKWIYIVRQSDGETCFAALQVRNERLSNIFSKKILHFVFFSIFGRNVRQYVACREMEKSTFPLGFVCICNLHLPKAALCRCMYMNNTPYIRILSWTHYKSITIKAARVCNVLFRMQRDLCGLPYACVSMWLHRCTRCDQRYMRANVANKQNQKRTHFRTS